MRPLGHGYTGAMSIAEFPLRWRRFRAAPSLSRETRKRLRFMEFYLAHGRHVRLTCRHFGISTDHLYRWWRRYDPAAARESGG